MMDHFSPDNIAAQKAAHSLTASDVAILPFIPYLLQDFWSLGSSPDEMIELLCRNGAPVRGSRVLDLACGKGGVAVPMAKAFGVYVRGIDFMSEFIEEAGRKAAEFGVENLCEFIAGDIMTAIPMERDYEIAICGGPGSEVFGGYEPMLAALTSVVRPGGRILLDDACAENDSSGEYPTRKKFMDMCAASGLEVADAMFAETLDVARAQREQNWIEARALELSQLHPTMRSLFMQYASDQAKEYHDLAHGVTCVNWLLRRR